MEDNEVTIGVKLSQSSIPEETLPPPPPPPVGSATIIQPDADEDRIGINGSFVLSADGSSGGRISISRSRSRTTSIGDRSSKSSKTLSRLSASWVDWRKSFLNTILNYLRRVFSFPLVNEPISFTKPNVSTDQNSGPGLTANEVEELCNYDAATKELFDAILQGRKETMDAKDRYHYQHVDLKKFPGWDETNIERLKSTFQVFDVTGDGLVDFDEMTTVLAEFGDKTSEEVRKRHFDVVDVDRSGAIDFEEFLTMIYSLTMRKDDDIDAESAQFGESYKMIDQNMSRIRSLDVVQQLQAGLF